MKERRGFSINGWLVILLVLGSGVIGSLYFEEMLSFIDEAFLGIIISGFGFILMLALLGFYTIEPNESVIQTFLGNYIGTDKNSGFRWTSMFFKRRKVSLRVHDFETELIKVNDLNGNPIEVSAIVIWRVKDTYASYFDVEDYKQFIQKQSVAALRGLAMKYPYESVQKYKTALITHTEVIAENLKVKIQERVDLAGLEIIEARINHLSYAKEIAAAMLQRQQASAIVSAKTEIVDGAVGMVKLALENLEKENIVSLQEADKRKLVSNLLVVLCSDQGTQPMIEAAS